MINASNSVNRRSKFFYSKCQISSFQSFYSVVYPSIMNTLDDLHLLHVLIYLKFFFFFSLANELQLLWHTSSLHKRCMVRSWVQNPPCITNKENSEEVKSYRLEVQILLGETSERIFLFPPPLPPISVSACMPTLKHAHS